MIFQEGSRLPSLSDQPLTSIFVNDTPALVSPPPVLSDTLASFISMVLNPLSSDHLCTCFLPSLGLTEHKQNRVGRGSLSCLIPYSLSGTCDGRKADDSRVFVE